MERTPHEAPGPSCILNTDLSVRPTLFPRHTAEILILPVALQSLGSRRRTIRFVHTLAIPYRTMARSNTTSRPYISAEIWMESRHNVPALGQPTHLHSKQGRKGEAADSGAFATSRIVILGLYYTLLSHLVAAFDACIIGEVQPSDVNVVHRTLFRSLLQAVFSAKDLTYAPPLAPRAFLLRAHTAVSWILENMVYLGGANAALGLFFVCAVHVDGPADWPPLFGSPAAAVSLTRFWSLFWHPLATRP